MYPLFYSVGSLSDLPHLHKVEPFLSNILKVFHWECFLTIQRFYFPKIVFELINIHILDLILWNVKMHCMRWIIIWLVPYLRNILITFITRYFLPASGGKHQVECTHQNLEYIQDLPYHRMVLVPHHYCKPYWTYPHFL